MHIYVHMIFINAYVLVPLVAAGTVAFQALKESFAC